jgi:ATP-dependent DNA helicase DinG
MNKDIEKTFALDGELAHYFANFQPRQGQTEMADECLATIRQGGTLIAQAGTGIGKTFAYGVAALLSGRKVIISTATKSLQDQLSKRDLPALCQALSMPARIQVLKGRENYVCEQRLAQAAQHYALTNQRGLQAAVAEVKAWTGQSHSGELADILGSRSNPIWDKVCARSEFCALVKCDSDRCTYPALRSDAENADILVINHHLLGADLALRAAGMQAILPDREALIVDEGHQLAPVLFQALGQSASTLSWHHSLRDLAVLVQTEIKDMPLLTQAIQEAQAALEQWQALAQDVKMKQSATDWLQDKDHESALSNFIAQWRLLLPQLLLASDRIPAIKAQAALLARLAEVTINWQHVSQELIPWVEAQAGHWFLYITPMSISDSFADAMKRLYGSVILTSATLAAGDDFDYLKRQLGLWEAKSYNWNSPYNYQDNALLYLPSHLPEPNSEDYTLTLMRRMWPLLIANGGRAFLLFTSYKAMTLAANTLRPHLPFPLLVQGEQDSHQLIASFRSKGNAVLIATASFWEGVDVSGDALSLVMIDKIPFSPPDDPVARAREKTLEEKGLSAFACEQLPDAIMSLVQGAGRLIRSETDTGVLVIGDPRISNRRYGKQILAALPPMKQTRHSTEAVAFMKREPKIVGDNEYDNADEA